MKISINKKNSNSTVLQLITQIKKCIQEEKIIPGDQLPSIRQLANDLNINNKTVAKAFHHLKRDAIIKSKGFYGTYVHENAKANSNQNLTASISIEFTALIKKYWQSGITKSEFRTAFDNSLNKVTGA